MHTLESKKELLSVLRAAFGISIAIILTLTSGLIKMYYEVNIDPLFYVGIFFDIMLVLGLPIIITFLVKYINEIGEL